MNFANTAVIPLIALVIIAFILIAVLLLVREAQATDLADRLKDVTGGGVVRKDGMKDSRILDLIRNFGVLVARKTSLFSQEEMQQFSQALSYAGIDPRRNLPLLLGGKVVLAIIVPVLVYVACVAFGVYGPLRIIALGFGVVVGLRGAQMIIDMIGRPFLRAVRKGIPDAIDLLVISVEAGLGLEAALTRVASEMNRSNRPAAMQLAALAEDLRVMPDRQMAFDNLKNRAADESMQRLGAILSQSMQFGTPLAQALRAVSEELRRQRVIMLEERANKLPVLLILPLVLFIMPCIVIVMVGPSIISLVHVLGNLSSGGFALK